MNTIAIVEIGAGRYEEAKQMYDSLNGQADWYYYDEYDALEINDLEEFYNEVLVI